MWFTFFSIIFSTQLQNQHTRKKNQHTNPVSKSVVRSASGFSIVRVKAGPLVTK